MPKQQLLPWPFGPCTRAGWVFVLCFAFSAAHAASARADSSGTDDEISRPGVHLQVSGEKKILHGRPGTAKLTLFDDHARALADERVEIIPHGAWTGSQADSNWTVHSDENGVVVLDEVLVETGHGGFTLRLSDGEEVEGSLRAVPQWMVIVPPILAILLALIFRQVVLALAAGVWVGAWISVGDPFLGILHTLDTYIVGALADPFQATIIMFTASMGGMVGVMARSGGTQGVVDLVGRLIRGVKSAQVMTWLLGLLIFFDDYTNTLVVGNTMRPITDRMRISREKLSYIVDSTAAPVTTVALISTWVGYQVSLIREGLQEIGSDGGSAYSIFIQSIPYATYSWLAIAFVFMVAIFDRDFGPMLTAERRARHEGLAVREGASPLMDEVAEQLSESGAPDARAHRAVVPVVVLLLASLVGLYWDGRQQLLAQLGSAGLAGLPLREFFSHADPARALFWAAIAGSLSAIVLALAGRSLSLNRAVEAWVGGCKAMMAALIILVLAWSIKDVCSELGTGPVVVDWTTGNLPPHLLPSVTFAVAAFIAFSTGTSWASMAILMPIVIPLGHRLPELAHLSAPHAQGILVASIAAVLSGSVWGDHCSPISDTTIMSSMASGSDHIDHVRTQIPYALSAGGLTVLLGTLPAGFSISPWISLPVALLAVGLLVRFVGKPVGERR